MKLSLTILGRPIAKKNSKRLITVRGRVIPISSKAFMQFEHDALMQLLPYRKYKFDKPVTIDYEFFIQGKYHVDVDNLISSLNDIVQKSGILVDDDLIYKGTFIKRGGSSGWSTKIRISDE